MKGTPRKSYENCPLWQVVQGSERLGDSTKRVYLNAIGEWLQFAGEPSTGWSLAQAQAWYKHLCTRVQIKSANCKLAALKYASKRWAALAQRPDLDFANALETRRDNDVKLIRSLTFEEAALLLEACNGTRPSDIRDFAAITIGLRTGMRRMSLVGMLLEKFDRTPEGVQVEVPIKGNRQHKVPLDDVAMAALQPWLNYLKSCGVTAGAVFRGVQGMRGVADEGLSVEGLWKTLKRRARNAGIQDFSPHVLRHTFVTWCRAAGVPDYQIAAVTGHKGGAGLERILGVYTDKSVGRSAIAALPRDLWER